MYGRAVHRADVSLSCSRGAGGRSTLRRPLTESWVVRQCEVAFDCHQKSVCGRGLVWGDSLAPVDG